MSRNGAGTYVPPAGGIYPAVYDTIIDQDKFNILVADIVNALTGSVAANGETPITANIPMSTFKFTGLGDGSADTDSANMGQLRGSIFGRKNAIVNGNFDVWQGGTTGSAGTIADQWLANNTGSTFTQSRGNHTLGQTLVPGEPKHFYVSTVTHAAGAGNFVTVEQRLEDVRTYAGQDVVLTFYAYADAVKNIAVELYQSFGTGGGESATVTAIGVTTCALTTAFQKFTIPITIPSISGKTIGASDGSFLSLVFWLDAGTTFNARTNSLGNQSGTFRISQVQLEAGTLATPFEKLPLSETIAQCERYFEKSFAIDTTPAQNIGINTGELNFPSYKAGALPSPSQTVQFRTRKRAAPTITTYSPAAASAEARDIDVPADCTGTAIFNAADTGFVVRATGNAGSAVGNSFRLHWTASSRL